jgi:signal transduction protein with GAF and PtsI domain
LGISSDITKYKQEQNYLLLIKEIKNLLERAIGLKKVSYKILKLLCTTFNLDYGEIWLMDFSANTLRNLDYWSDPKVEDLAFNLKSREITFKPGIDLPGKMFQGSKPIWIANILKHSDLVRTEEAIQADLNSALGIPIVSHKKSLGVIVCLD